MKRNFWRFFIATVISVGGFCGTVVWFKLGKDDRAHGTRKPLAQLSQSTNEVQRKPLQRVIWESVNKNDELFTGEAIRTAPNAEAQLLFLKTGTLVHLDPDSLVVLEENDKGLILDFLQGNLFVQASGKGDAGAQELTLKSGSGEIKVNSADLSLSKNKNGRVDLEVHRGEATLKQGNKKTALDTTHSAELSDQGVTLATDHIQVFRPLAGESVYLNLAKSEKLNLTWKPLAPGYTITTEFGETRGALTKQGAASAPGEVGQVAFKAKPGRWFLRLTATPTAPDSKLPALASSVIPFTVGPKSPPTLVEPRQEASVLKIDTGSQVTFKWLSRHKFVSQVFEMASDPSFKNADVRENLTGEATNFRKKISEGTHYWRVTGFLKHKEKNEPLSSAPGKFSVVAQRELKPPTLLWPPHQHRLTLPEVQKNNLTLKWQKPKDVERLHVLVEMKNKDAWKKIYDQDTDLAAAKVTDLTPGEYRWQVASYEEDSERSKVSKLFSFTIEDLAHLEWVNVEPTVEYEFSTPAPSLSARWKAPVGNELKYRFKVSPAQEEGETGKWQMTKQTLFDIAVPSEGAFIAVVEALNNRDLLVARSEPKTFTVKRRPLLPAPRWAADTPEVLKSDSKGNLTFAWQQVEGAERYLMILESPDGAVIEQKEISRTTASLSRLKPGEYHVHLKSVDGLKRPGLNGDKRKVSVPNSSDIRAPKIKAMKVK